MNKNGKEFPREVIGDGRAIIVRGEDGDGTLARFMKKKTLGVPNWGWGIVLASVGLYHVSK